MEKPKQNKEKSDYRPSPQEEMELHPQEQEAYDDLNKKISQGIYVLEDIKNEKGELIAQKVTEKESGKIIAYNNFQKAKGLLKQN